MHRVPVKETQILIHFPRLLFFPGDDKAAGRLLPQIGDEMSLLRVHTAGDPHRIPTFFDTFFYFQIFTKPPQRFC